MAKPLSWTPSLALTVTPSEQILQACALSFFFLKLLRMFEGLLKPCKEEVVPRKTSWVPVVLKKTLYLFYPQSI